MRIRRRMLLVSGVLLLVCLLLLVPPASATSWSNWKTKAVGDVTENSLPTYWTITSTPYSGYEDRLWSNWHDVISSKVDYDYDDEIRFSSSTSQMGVIEFTSKMKIEDTEEVIIQGQVAAWYSYAQVKTLGYVKLYDTTTQTTVWSYPIQSGTTPYSWHWQTYYEELPLNKNHDYVIKLVGCDAWSQQQVRVLWESAEVWFYAPYYRTLSHGPDTWRHEWLWHYYVCRWRSDFYFKQGPLDDMLRDHIPYVKGGGLPYGWDPCYLHEFRSVPWDTLQYDYWYSTDLPGSYGVTHSSDYEAAREGYREVEVYTRNPSLINAGHLYYVSVHYTVWATGSMTMTLESELGNENDLLAALSPPAYPVAGIEIASRDVYHNYKSYFGFFAAKALSSDSNMSTPFEESMPITYIENHQWFDVIIAGVYPHYLKIYTRLKIESKSDLTLFQEENAATARDGVDRAAKEPYIPATITFDGLATVNSVLDLAEKYNLKVLRFRFTAENGNGVIRGQGTPIGDYVIPVVELENFIEGHNLLGIQSVDVQVMPNVIELLMGDEAVFAVDFAAFLAAQNGGISPDEFSEVHWYTEDASWYLSFFGSS